MKSLLPGEVTEYGLQLVEYADTERSEIPRYGGMLYIDVLDSRLAHCTSCDWRGVPSVHGGVVQTVCPSCEERQVTAEVAVEEETRRRWLGLTRGRLAPDPVVAGVQRRVVDVVVGRNDPCPCGSGRKHKKCCGA